MAVDALDTKHLRDLFGTPEMRAVFDEVATIGRYLEVEQALARVQANLGLIPRQAAEAIAAVTLDDLDLGAHAEQTGIVGYPIAPLVAQLAERVRDGLGEYAHWGATTQDIMDTAVVLQIRDALDIIDLDLDDLAAVLAGLAAEHVSTPIAGRSHLQHALPITFGYKVATWLAAVSRHQQRLAQARARTVVGQFGGAVGTLASLYPHGIAVRDALCNQLDLAVPEIAWHTTRDSLTEVVLVLANLTATLAKIGTDLVLLAQTEVGEIREPWAPGRGTSSTMPQKRNPIGSALLRTIASSVRSDAMTMLEAGIQDHERATGAWAAEWIALPRVFVASAAALRHAAFILRGLEVDAPRMASNLAATAGLIAAEAVMMRLASDLGRQRAHDLVAEIANRTSQQGLSFIDALITADEVSAVLDRAELEELLLPGSLLGHASDMVEAVLRRHREER